MDTVDKEVKYNRKILVDAICELFEISDGPQLQALLNIITIREIKGGDYLMHQGDVADSMYLLLSGRLGAMIPDKVGKKQIVGHISRGESVGEMALLNEGAKRTADIYAIRNSILAEINKDHFNQLILQYPSFLKHISRLVVTRLQNQLSFQKQPNSFVVFTLFKADHTEKIDDAVTLFVDAIKAYGKTKVIDAAYINQSLDTDGIADSLHDYDRHRVSLLLNELESEYDYLMLIGDEDHENWSKFCLRHSDYSLVMMDTGLGPVKRPIERIMDDITPDSGWNVKLMLIHPADCILPSQTLRWYDGRKINGHHHVRHHNLKDMSRIIRIVCGTSNGLVLSGGGAKGMAHVGVYKALSEYNIDIDYVCGTSIGSIMAALIAMDHSAVEVSEMSERVFMSNPTPLWDFKLFPFYGLLGGKKIDRLLQETFQDVQIEDLWIPYFCVSSDLTSSKMRLHEQGPLWKSIRASISLPGVFPPVVYDRHVLVDGVVFNNIPVDIITKKGVGNVIGVNLDTDEIHEVNVDELPSFLQRWGSKILRKNKYQNLPNMMETIAKSTFAMSENQSRDHFSKIDLFFNPPVTHFGLMDWKSFHEIAAIGYYHARELLSERDDLEQFQYSLKHVAGANGQIPASKI